MTEFNQKVTDLEKQVKEGGYSDRNERAAVIDQIIDDYVERSGEIPDGKELERIADLFLREELADKNEHKMKHEEYPIMSAYQLARRKAGVHVRKDDKRLTETSLTENTATNGRDYRHPSRRQITTDKAAKSRNAERRRKHTRFKSGKGGAVFKVSVDSGEKCVMDGKKYHYYYNPKA